MDIGKFLCIETIYSLTVYMVLQLHRLWVGITIDIYMRQYNENKNTHTRVHTLLLTYTVYTHTCMSTGHTHTYVDRLHTHICRHTYTVTHIHSHTQYYIHVCTHILHVYICTCTGMYMH